MDTQKAGVFLFGLILELVRVATSPAWLWNSTTNALGGGMQYNAAGDARCQDGNKTHVGGAYSAGVKGMFALNTGWIMRGG